MVEGERGQRVGATGEDDDTDAVVWSMVDEGLDDGFDRLKAVERFAVFLVILGEHGAGEIDAEHEVVTFGVDLMFILDALRAGERDDEQHEPAHGQHRRPTGGGRERRAVPSSREWHQQHGNRPPAAQPQDHWNDQEREKPEG